MIDDGGDGFGGGDDDGDDFGDRDDGDNGSRW